MEYVPAPTMAGRTSLRDIYTSGANGYTINSGTYTAFNWFIDTYDVNKDADGNKTDVLEMYWPNNGVLEMDCLLCHLKGYDYGARMEMLRQARFDASRAVGAGVAAPNTVAWGTNAWAPVGYGTEVDYNDVNATGGVLKFSKTTLLNIKASPPNDNCVFCHANIPAVDWKKRGDNWKKDVDAHWLLGCMGCHQGKVGSAIGTSGSVSSSDLGQCDPARGNPVYSSVWGKTKNTIKTCEDCHLRAGYDSGLGTYSPDYGAPDPTGTHEYYGLTAKMCQTGTDGKINASHLDIIDCAACHVRKISDEAWNIGGAIVDASGPDHEGRMTDHENQYVHRDMQENLCYTWQNGKIIPSSVLTTIFWRDKNDVNRDVNNDGRGGGMDAPLTPHILGINLDYNATTMSVDNSGIIDSTVIAERISRLESDLDAYLGDISGNPLHIKLCSMAVPFKVNHNVSPASYALGHTCGDCHGGSAGIFNGSYELQGKNMDLSYNATTQVTALTWVNAMTQKTDVHGNLKNKSGKRSIARQPLSGGSDNLTAMDRDEFLYEDTFMVRDSSWHAGAITSSAITFPTMASTTSNTKGWALVIDANDTATNTVVTRARAVSALVPNVGGLLINLAAGVADFTNDFEFTITSGGGSTIVITPNPGYKIRINPKSIYTASLGLTSAVWTAKDVIGVNQSTHATGVSWVSYLNTLDLSGCDCWPDANASVCDNNSTAQGFHGHGIGCNCDNITATYCDGSCSASPPTGTGICYGVNATACQMYWEIYEVSVCTEIWFEAKNDPCPGTEYYWNFNDASGFEEGTQFSAKTVGLKVSHEFRDLGIFKVVLTVKNIYGNVDSHMILVNVVREP